MKRTSTVAGLSVPSVIKKAKYNQGGVIWTPGMIAKKRAMSASARAELKNIDVNPIGFPAFGATSGTLTLLNGCVQGAGASNRISRRVTLRSVQLRGRIQMAATTTGASPIRLIVFYDRQSNGAAPSATDLLTGNSISDFTNLSNNRRFLIVADEIRSCIGTAGPQSVYFNFYRKLNLVTEFNTGNAGTVADIATGSLYVLAYASPGIGVASLNCDVQSRVRFTDN